jgi:hypothetical protein
MGTGSSKQAARLSKQPPAKSNELPNVDVASIGGLARTSEKGPPAQETAKLARAHTGSDGIQPFPEGWSIGEAAATVS